MEKEYTQELEAFADLLQVMDTLRERCPWDRKQTMESLRTLTVEEVYELGDAILKKNAPEVKKELGDLLMHVVFYAIIGREHGEFDITDVLHDICAKLRYRHPHIYGNAQADTADDVSKAWERLKLKEKDRHARVLEGVPATLPALVKAYRVQDKVRGVGFDWRHRDDVWEKVAEEMTETREAIRGATPDAIEEEFGDLLFALVNAARLHDVNPEDALERANRKFIRRFTHVEEGAARQGRSLTDLSLEEMDALWDEAKQQEHQPNQENNHD